MPNPVEMARARALNFYLTRRLPLPAGLLRAALAALAALVVVVRRRLLRPPLLVQLGGVGGGVVPVPVLVRLVARDHLRKAEEAVTSIGDAARHEGDPCRELRSGSRACNS